MRTSGVLRLVLLAAAAATAALTADAQQTGAASAALALDQHLIALESAQHLSPQVNTHVGRELKKKKTHSSHAASTAGSVGSGETEQQKEANEEKRHKKEKAATKEYDEEEEEKKEEKATKGFNDKDAEEDKEEEEEEEEEASKEFNEKDKEENKEEESEKEKAASKEFDEKDAEENMEEDNAEEEGEEAAEHAPAKSDTLAPSKKHKKKQSTASASGAPAPAPASDAPASTPATPAPAPVSDVPAATTTAPDATTTAPAATTAAPVSDAPATTSAAPSDAPTPAPATNATASSAVGSPAPVTKVVKEKKIHGDKNEGIIDGSSEGSAEIDKIDLRNQDGWISVYNDPPVLSIKASLYAFIAYNDTDVCDTFNMTLNAVEQKQDGNTTYSYSYHVVAFVNCMKDGVDQTEGRFLLNFRPEGKRLLLTECGHREEGEIVNWIMIRDNIPQCMTPPQRKKFLAQPMKHIHATNGTTTDVTPTQTNFFTRLEDLDVKEVAIAGSATALLIAAVIVLVVFVVRKRRAQRDLERTIAGAKAETAADDDDDDETADLPVGSKERRGFVDSSKAKADDLEEGSFVNAPKVRD